MSILMPCRNAGETLGEALASLAAQSFPDFEVVIADDGSEDDSAEVAAGYARRDGRFRLLRGAHAGIVEALRRAYAHSEGTVLARMDADDIAEADRLAKQLAFLDANPRVGLCGTLVSHAGAPAAIGRKRYLHWINSLRTHAEIDRERFVECPIPHPTFLMRREAYESAGGYVDRGWPEDYQLLLNTLRAGWRLGKVAEPLLRWRHSRGRHSMTDPRYAPDRFRAVKRHFLRESVLASGRRFFQWGAGEVGKPWLREWGEYAPDAVVDINPRKIGRRIHGVSVIAPEDLPPPGDAVVLVAVGAPGARDEIREWFGPRGYREGQDYLFIA